MPDVTRSLSDDAITALVRAVQPDTTVRTATLADSGYLPVYRVTLDRAGDRQRRYLKTAPPDADRDHGVGLEARLLARLHDEGLAVPDVVGLLDDRESLPTPAFLMTALDGRIHDRESVAEMADGTLGAVARSCGRHLADLHGVSGPAEYGFLAPAGGPFDGERPPGDGTTVTVSGGDGDWSTVVGGWAGHAVGGLGASRFADLAEDVEATLADDVGAIYDAPAPAFAHVDGAIENLVLAPDEPAVTGLLDWAFTVAATPAYDLVCVADGLQGGAVAQLPSVPARYALVLDALLEGYRERAPERGTRVAARLDAHGRAYRLLVLARGMAMCDEWFRDRGYGADDADRAAAGYRDAVAPLLG